ncbi:MAG: hypothetical protein OEW11_09975, partial [Nitrospirota bacterium]|nr:hypothetical protein [Nitrospirota bacterium]
GADCRGAKAGTGVEAEKRRSIIAPRRPLLSDPSPIGYGEWLGSYDRKSQGVSVGLVFPN